MQVLFISFYDVVLFYVSGTWLRIISVVFQHSSFWRLCQTAYHQCQIQHSSQWHQIHRLSWTHQWVVCWNVLLTNAFLYKICRALCDCVIVPPPPTSLVHKAWHYLVEESEMASVCPSKSYFINSIQTRLCLIWNGAPAQQLHFQFLKTSCVLVHYNSITPANIS